MSKVLLVDDHQVVRDGLKNIIREHGMGREFGEATTVVEALKLAAEQAWDLAIVDISLVGRSGLEAVRELKRLRPRMPVLVLSMHSEEQYAARLQGGCDRVHHQEQFAGQRVTASRTTIIRTPMFATDSSFRT